MLKIFMEFSCRLLLYFLAFCKELIESRVADPENQSNNELLQMNSYKRLKTKTVRTNKILNEEVNLEL